MKKNTVNVGIIGVGNIGSAHLNAIYSGQVEGMSVSAVCDISQTRIYEIGQKYRGIKCFSDYNELLLSNIDAVIVAVPHPLHSEIAISALLRGKHVLVEKPIDISVKKAAELISVAKYTKLKFAIMFNQRTAAIYSKAREIVKSGELGEIKRSNWIITNWYRTEYYYKTGGWRATWAGEGGGVLVNQAPHQLDMWQWILGMPQTVSAHLGISKHHDIEVEDEATIYTTYENGAIGTFITSTGEFPGTNRLEIIGTKGKLVIEDGMLKRWFLREDEREVSKNATSAFVSIDYDYSVLKDNGESGHKGILANFAESILKGTPLIAEGYEGLNELSISAAAYLSNEKGGIPVHLPVTADEFEAFLDKKRKNSKIKPSVEEGESTEYNPRWKVRF